MSNYHLRPKDIMHCQRCGKELTRKQRNNRQKYCGRDCIWPQGPVPMCRCEMCQKIFKPISHDRITCCGKRCAALYRYWSVYVYVEKWIGWPKKFNKIYYHECGQCGDAFIGRFSWQKYCSDECRYCVFVEQQRHGVRRRKGYKERNVECMICGEPITTHRLNNNYCSDTHARKASRQRRNKRMKGSFVEVVSINQLYDRDGGRCMLCGRRLNKIRTVPHPLAITVDHIIPLSLGGEHSYKNTQLACFMCNSIKGNGIIDGGEQLRMFG